MFKGAGEFEAARLRQTRRDVDTPRTARLVCCDCSHPITSESERITVQGAHQHTFTNPHQVTYRIGCFRDAPGCSYAGAATNEFTWFSGYSWRIALCAGCGTHIGWVYRKLEGAAFHGLIVNQLRLEQGT